ncbi:MAG: tetratricopeptide repeat protein [Acetobacteraceae bacterium]
MLLDQAQYWSGIYQYDKADQALKRVLTLDPNNPDGLALEAQSAADRGDQQTARAALVALRAARPDDPRIATITQTLQAGAIDQTTLTQARALASAGKSAEAVAAYRRVFRGDTPRPPSQQSIIRPSLIPMEIGRPVGWVLRRNCGATRKICGPSSPMPSCSPYHDETRAEGIQRLQSLAKISSIADLANKDLRQAILWLPVLSDSIPLYESYLADHPGDAELQQRANLAKTDSTAIRISGYNALQAGQYDEAERDFTQALTINANDSDSMVGLALVRLHQRRVDEGKSLLRQAISIDPTKADTYQSLIDGTGRPRPSRRSITARSRHAGFVVSTAGSGR